MLGTVLAQRIKLKPGQHIELKTPEGIRRFRIAGITNEYTVGGLALYMERRVAEKILNVQGVDAYIVKAKPGMLESLQPKLKALAGQYGLLLQSLAAVHRIVQGMLMGIVGGLWVLLALSFMVAAFGMVNTLTMNVLEQTRELALLRAVAMTRTQSKTNDPAASSHHGRRWTFARYPHRGWYGVSHEPWNRSLLWSQRSVQALPVIDCWQLRSRLLDRTCSGVPAGTQGVERRFNDGAAVHVGNSPLTAGA